MKTCLVLEGGALRGIYTAGVLDALLKHNIKVDCIIGVSAGALFGVNYKSKQKERALRYNKHYCKRKEYMGIYSFLTTGNIMNKDFCFDKLVNVYDPFDYETFKNNKVKFYTTVTNVETGKAEYIEMTDLKDKNQMEYLRAGGSMPVVSKIVEIEGKKYLDGGIADSIPIEQAKKMGYDKIIVVTTRPLEYRKKKSPMLPFKLRYKKYPNFLKSVENRYKEYNKTVENIINLEKKNKIFVIRPTKKIKISKIEKNPYIIQKQYDLGYNDATNKMNNLIKFIK